ncbi:MAG: Si-specific NAD(P)(+) transhydrogenase [Gemmataceae bacterium]|nr:Si-specific NAD(P)(+) transhydrogenase [Gemmataceae bacterium]MDW8263747.1 Si-specific NAD(P)(+) transhydrogenase [Gemmataceae bacterium]
MEHKAPEEYDLVVIGTGPGGEGAAMQAAKSGLSTAVVERYRYIGGGCTHWATIPSKSLRHAISQMTEINKNPLFHAAGISVHLSFPELRRAARSVIDRQVEMRQSFYERNRVPIIRGHARFLDPHTIEAREENGAHHRLRAKYFVIATGSRPYRPPDVDFHHPRIFDSDTILRLDFTPHSVTVYGAGVVGCEYASMFRNLGCKVNLINSRSKLLDFLDDEIIDALSYHMRDQGILIRHNETYEKVTGVDDGVILSLQSGKQVKTDILLWANGRTGNTDRMGLEEIGLKPNQRGQLEVNEHFQTALPHIYAVGDVIGFPSLASAAYVQGRYAASHIVSGRCEASAVRMIPTGIYTSPEISSIGRTERELTAAKVPYEIGHAFFKHLARAHITGHTVGMLKILFHRETLEILGIHCFGANASEIIHIGQAIMAQPGSANSLLYFINTTFNYPTMAEAYRVAALNGYNRLF